MMPGLIAYSATHPEFGAAWRNSVMEPPRHELRTILRRAIKQGKLQPDIDLNLAISLLLGPMLYNHIFGHPPRTPNDKLGKLTAEAFVRAFAKS
jgi:Tetracyclin repressor-like, C-terminal domain